MLDLSRSTFLFYCTIFRLWIWNISLFPYKKKKKRTEETVTRESLYSHARVHFPWNMGFVKSTRWKWCHIFLSFFRSQTYFIARKERDTHVTSHYNWLIDIWLICANIFASHNSLLITFSDQNYTFHNTKFFYLIKDIFTLNYRFNSQIILFR